MNKIVTLTLTGGVQAWPEVVMPTRRDLFYDGRWQEAPVGGYKQSGIGRVMCFEQLRTMTQVKNVHIRLEA